MWVYVKVSQFIKDECFLFHKWTPYYTEYKGDTSKNILGNIFKYNNFTSPNFFDERYRICKKCGKKQVQRWV